MSNRKYLAEFVGTAILVIIGCGSVVVAGYGASGAVGMLAISLAFGFIVAGLVYAIGPISGCHINPAITLSVWAAGGITAREVPGYILAQMSGAVVGAGLLVLLLIGRAKGYDVAVDGLGQNGWGENYIGGYSLTSAFCAEVLATFILGLVVLLTTRKGVSTEFAGLAIGLTLTVLLLTFDNVSGASLNPARSFGPAVFVGGTALAQLWLFLLAPVIGGLLAGVFTRFLWRVEPATDTEANEASKGHPAESSATASSSHRAPI
jgi:aquaporin Z